MLEIVSSVRLLFLEAPLGFNRDRAAGMVKNKRPELEAKFRPSPINLGLLLLLFSFTFSVLNGSEKERANCGLAGLARHGNAGHHGRRRIDLLFRWEDYLKGVASCFGDYHFCYVFKESPSRLRNLGSETAQPVSVQPRERKRERDGLGGVQ